MSRSPKTKQTFNVEVIKTPEGYVPTVDGFHKVVDGLFGEILDTRKDIARLIPNLESELNNLREILAENRVMMDIINNNITKVEDDIKEQGKILEKMKKIADVGIQGQLSEAELTEQSKKAIAKLVRAELVENTRPLYDSIKLLEKEIANTNNETIKRIEKQLITLKDQIEDLSSKTELQMLEILESVNQSPIEKESKALDSTIAKTTKKKLTS